MASINDWAAKAARRIREEFANESTGVALPHVTEERVAAIIAAFAEPLVALLREAKREHDNGESNDCPMAEPEYTYNRGEPCTCGTDAWNARVDVVLSGKVHCINCSAVLGSTVYGFGPTTPTGAKPREVSPFCERCYDLVRAHCSKGGWFS